MAQVDFKVIEEILARGLSNATNNELALLKALSDDNLLRTAGNRDGLVIVEASRRLRNALQDLKNALQEEERAIGRLTRWLLRFTIAIFALTFVLVVLTAVLAVPVVVDLWHHWQHPERSEVVAGLS